ncbi:hypothetical protein LPJ60_005360 [Coemansia sp. RSA 2675]|nr:hypothetical protein LPJ60_005360 [Coemansia sp. RSA 2675]
MRKNRAIVVYTLLVRKWFVRHLLHPLCKQIDKLDSLFDQHGLGHLSCRRAVLDTAAPERAKLTRLGGIGIAGISSRAQNASAIPQTLIDLSLKHGELPETKECMVLEKYLSIPGYLCRDYIIQVARKCPHLGLVVKDSYYDVSAGQTNLFTMLTIFVLEVRRECVGYLSLTYLGGKHVGLLAAIGDHAQVPLSQARLNDIRHDVRANASMWADLRQEYPPAKSCFEPLNFAVSSWSTIATEDATGLGDDIDADEAYS